MLFSWFSFAHPENLDRTSLVHQRSQKIDSKISGCIFMKTIQQTQRRKGARNHIITNLPYPNQSTIHVQPEIFHHIGEPK
jgi:hypothetical protein